MENPDLDKRKKWDGTEREDTIREKAHTNADVYLAFVQLGLGKIFPYAITRGVSGFIQ